MFGQGRLEGRFEDIERKVMGEVFGDDGKALVVRRIIGRLATFVAGRIIDFSPPLAATHPGSDVWSPAEDRIGYGLVEIALFRQRVRYGIQAERRRAARDVVDVEKYAEISEKVREVAATTYEALASPALAQRRAEIERDQVTFDKQALDRERYAKKVTKTKAPINEIDVSKMPVAATPTSAVAGRAETCMREALDALPNLTATSPTTLATYQQFRRAITRPETFAWQERQLPAKLETRVKAASVAYATLSRVQPNFGRDDLQTAFKTICAMLAVVVAGKSRLYALSVQLQIDAVVSALTLTPLETAFFAYMSGVAREVITCCYLQSSNTSSKLEAVALAMNPEAMFFGTGTPLACAGLASCDVPLCAGSGRFRDTSMADGRLSVGSYHSRADHPYLREQQGAAHDGVYYACPIVLLESYQPTKMMVALFFQYGQLQHLNCKWGDSSKTLRFL